MSYHFDPESDQQFEDAGLAVIGLFIILTLIGWLLT